MGELRVRAQAEREPGRGGGQGDEVFHFLRSLRLWLSEALRVRP